MSTTESTATSDPRALRTRAGRISLVVAIVVFSGKLFAYELTGSSAVLSDALESIVNIGAALVLIFSLRLAARPADRDHPYGHGKIEFFSAGIEGGLLFAAGAAILIEGGHALITGPEVVRLDLGILVVTVFGALNAVLGSYLVRTGKRTDSLALQADGRHVLADVWTTLGVVVGLGVVWVTGWAVLDPLVAIAVAVHVLREGFRLVRAAFRGLMDEADEDLLRDLAAALSARRQDSWLDLHGLRSRRSGATVHTDLTLVVPRYFDVEMIHTVHEGVERALSDAIGPASGAETVVHFDPCRPTDCPGCAMDGCPVRQAPLEQQFPLDLERVTRLQAEARD